MSKTSPARRAIHVLRPAEAKQQLARLNGRPSLALVPAKAESNATDSGSSGELWLYGVVGGWWRGFNAEGVADALRGMDVDHLTVRIHSPGGHASDGVAIANLLRNHRAKVTVVVDGLAASAASVIAVAGDEIVMCPGSQMMLHDASTGGWGNAASLRRAAEWVDAQSQNYAGVYAYAAGGTPESWREVMTANDGEGTWYTAEAAVAAGLATEVGTRSAAGSPPVDNEDDLDDDELFARALHDLDLLEQTVPASAAAAYAGTAAPTPPTASAEGSTTTQGTEIAVTFTDQQLTTMRDKLGLPETADEAAILAAVETVVDESLEERPANAAVPEGHVVIPAAQLETLTAGATAGVQAARTLHDRDREALLDANRTKIPTKELRAGWAKQYDLDPKATATALAAMPDLVPAEFLGHAHAHDADANASDAGDLTSVRDSEAYKNWSI